MNLARSLGILGLLLSLTGCVTATPPQKLTTYTGPSYGLSEIMGPLITLHVRIVDAQGVEVAEQHDGLDTLLADALRQNGVSVATGDTLPALDIELRRHGPKTAWIEKIGLTMPITKTQNYTINTAYTLKATFRTAAGASEAVVPVMTQRDVSVTTLNPSWLTDLHQMLQTDYDTGQVEAIGAVLHAIRGEIRASRSNHVG